MSIIFVLAMLGWFGFGIAWIVSLFKKNGKAKKNFGISFALFILFMITGNFVDTEEKVENSTETEKVDASNEDSKDETEDEAKAEAEEKAKAEDEAKAKAEAEEKAKVEAEAKAKAEAEEKAKAEAEAKAKEPISTDFSSFDDPYDNMTDIQKDAYWEDVKGKYVQWSGEVTEVTDKKVMLRLENDTFTYDVSATIKKEHRDKLININLGQTITINGKLVAKEGLIASWQLDDTEIIE